MGRKSNGQHYSCCYMVKQKKIPIFHVKFPRQIAWNIIILLFVNSKLCDICDKRILK